MTIAANLERFLIEKFLRDASFPTKQKFRSRYTKYAGATYMKICFKFSKTVNKIVLSINLFWKNKQTRKIVYYKTEGKKIVALF